MKESTYIKYRKLKAKLNSVCFYMMRIFPIDKKLVSVCTFEGKGGFGCNPKYVVQKLHEKDQSIKFVWFVNDMNKEFPDYIKKVPNTLISRAYWLTRSKVWIDNYRTRYGTKKRKDQYYLNTNHYTICLKRVGMWRGEGFSKMAYLVSKADADQIDDMLSDSDFCDEMYPKGLLYDKPLLRYGAPRCDILYNDKRIVRENLRKRHNIPSDAKIVMYAPTFREGASNGKRSVYSEEWSIDFDALRDSLHKKFGGEWYVCLRVHPQLANAFKNKKEQNRDNHIFDESQADDMYEVLAGVDAYITDYSSACFEAAYAGIPVFLYADDLDSYVRFRGGMFWDMTVNNTKDILIDKSIFKKIKTKLPFSVSTNNEELQDNIEMYNQKDYEKEIEYFDNSINLCFDGKASERTAELIMEKMKR